MPVRWQCWVVSRVISDHSSEDWRLGWITCNSMLRVILVVMHDIVRFLNSLSVKTNHIADDGITENIDSFHLNTGCIWSQSLELQWKCEYYFRSNPLLAWLNYLEWRWTYKLEGCLPRTEPEPHWYHGGKNCPPVALKPAGLRRGAWQQQAEE